MESLPISFWFGASLSRCDPHTADLTHRLRLYSAEQLHTRDHHRSVQNILSTPERSPSTTRPPQPLAITNLLSVSTKSPILGTSRQWDHTTSCVLWLVSFVSVKFVWRMHVVARVGTAFPARLSDTAL